MLNEFELQILFRIREIFQNPVLDKVMPFLTNLGDYGIFFIILSLIFASTKKYRKAGFTSCLALLMGVIIVNLVMKNAFARVRPYNLENGIVPVIANLTNDYSFPSGHSLASFEVGVGIFINDRKMGSWVLVLGFLISSSRLYLSLHYPTDVIFGALIGTIFAFTSKYIVEILMKKYDEYKQQKGKDLENQNQKA